MANVSSQNDSKLPNFPIMNQLTPKLNLPQKVKMRRIIKFATRAFWLFIAFILITQLFRLNLFLSKTSSSNLDQANAQVENLQKELDEIREYLLIPTSDSEKSDQNSQNNTVEAQTIDQVLDTIVTDYSREQQKLRLQRLYLNSLNKVTKNINSTQLASAGYQFSKKEDSVQPQYTVQSATEQESQQALVDFGFDGTKIYLNTPISESKFLSSQLKYFESEITKMLSPQSLKLLEQMVQASQVAKSELTDFFAETPQNIQTLLATKSLKLSQSPNSEYILLGLKQDNSKAFSIEFVPESSKFRILDTNSKLIGESQTSFATLLSNLETYLKLNTFETLIQKNVLQKVEQLQKSINSSEYQKQLSDLGLKVQVQETDQNFEFNFVKNTNYELVYSIQIDKQTAQVNKVQNGLKTKISYKNEPIIHDSDSKGQTFLIAGKNGNLTDTMILANLDADQKQVSLLSIPRDLYVDGQKINSIFAKEGMESLTQKLESLVGTQIDNYLLIDMYAFIDVVDYIGGIQVYLDSEVVDPTYKTFDNGKWGTMYFAAGEHTLNGKQALRLARSRYTSSDFARAERQQLILASLKDKLTTLSFTDVRALSKIAVTMLSKTETDIPLNKAISYFFRYKDFQIANKSVLSTNNILVSAYSNELNQVNCAQCGRGSYVLIPKNNDWSLVRTYVASVFNS